MKLRTISVYRSGKPDGVTYDNLREAFAVIEKLFLSSNDSVSLTVEIESIEQADFDSLEEFEGEI